MDSEIKMMFNTILEEMGRVEERTNKRFDRIEKQLETMQHDINACKLEKDTISLLIKKIDQLEKGLRN